MTTLSASYEILLLEKVKNNDKSSFSLIFLHYYKDLVSFSYGIVKNLDTAEEIVQEVFIKLWENRASIVLNKSLKSYLLKSVQNRSLNWMHHLKVKKEYTDFIKDHHSLSENATENYIFHSELEFNLHKALKKIQVEYAEAFRMNRFDNLSYPEIAQKLGVSVRTIEVRIGKALLLLRDLLKESLLPWLLFLLHILYAAILPNLHAESFF